jgi:hypothetical protein
VACLVGSLVLTVIALALICFWPAPPPAPARVPLVPANQQIPVVSPFTTINVDPWVPCEGEVFLTPTSRCAPD